MNRSLLPMLLAASPALAQVNAGNQAPEPGVPFHVLDGKHAVSGAQPVGALLGALDTAWTANARLR